MELKNAKLMGGIGAILTLTAFIPKIGWLFAITGLVLVLLAIKEISNVVNDKKIFNNYLVAFILNIIGCFVVAIVCIVAIFVFVGQRIFRSGTMMNNMPFGGIFKNFGSRLPVAVIIVIAVVLVVAWAIVIIGSHFAKSSFDGIATGTKVEYFKTAGNLIFIGSVLLVVFGLGAILMFVGAILEIVGFFALPDKLEKPTLESGSTDSPTLTQ
jgi:uncharacterized membrane protein